MTTLTNAQLVLPDQVLNGALSFADGQITDIGPPGPGQDLAGDFLIPGLIDLHTDNLERQVLPRHNARWPSRSALLAHDAQCVAAGITTVFDALCLGDIGFEKARNQTFEDGLADLRAISTANILKTEHFLHLRCELPAPEMPALFESAIDDPLVRLISLMDHSPGLGQYADLEAHRKMREAEGFSLAEIEAMVLAQQANHHRYHLPHRALVLKAAAARNIPAASHDDRTAAEIARNFSEGIRIAEFPVAHSAAKAAKGFGIATIAGAPNIVRGGSHSGNVSVADLIADNLLDALASDYVPAAMLEAAFLATRHGRALPAAIALVTSGPAAIAGLFDRGRLAPGLRVDLVQVRLHENIPVIRAVWRAGERIA